MKRQGFFIIEFLIYLALLSSITVLIMHYCTHSLHFFNQNTTLHMQQVAHAATMDAIGTRMQKAPALLTAWKSRDPHAVVWRSENKDYGFIVHDTNLYYVRGTYEYGRWVTQHKELIARAIKNFSMNVQVHDAYICAFEFNLQTARYTLNKVVKPLAGVCL